MKATRAVLAVLIFLPAPSQASITRLLSLGVDNWQVSDNANFWSNPVFLIEARERALFEAGTQSTAGGALTAGSQWGGFHKSLGPSVLAAYVRRPYQVNDVTNNADPILTPLLGGMSTTNNVFGATGLDTAASFGAGGPFSATGSRLGITGAPAAFDRTIAEPSNLFDLIFAVPAGAWTFGMHFNYARNEAGETSRSEYQNAATGTQGSILLKRLTQEFNIRPAVAVGGENLRLAVVGEISLPFYEMSYEEARTNGAYSRSLIDGDNAPGAALAMQLSGRTREDTSLSWSLRLGQQSVDGLATYAEDSTPGGALETDRSAGFENKRRYLTTDLTWSRAYSRTMVMASLGYQHLFTRRSWNYRDALASANNQDDLVRSHQDVVPMRLALETSPWDWIHLRAGLQKNWFAESVSRVRDGDGTTNPTFTRTDTVLGEASGTANGVGLSFGFGLTLVPNLTIDTVVRQTLFFDGPNFIGGENPGVFAQGTITFRFGEAGDYDVPRKPLIPFDEIRL